MAPFTTALFSSIHIQPSNQSTNQNPHRILLRHTLPLSFQRRSHLLPLRSQLAQQLTITEMPPPSTPKLLEADKPTILVSEKLSDSGLELLRCHANVECVYGMSAEELVQRAALCDALIVRSGTKVTRQVLEAGKGRLRVVGRAGVGIDNVDLGAATECGCLVVNAPTANTVAAAEHSIALLAAMARNVAPADASMKAGKWERGKYVGVSMAGKTMAVMGFGKVGTEVARRAKGLGMNVIAHDPFASADRGLALGVQMVSFDQAISRADFISLHMPLTPNTSNMFNDHTFSKMKKGVRIVNVARGGVIDEEALFRALENGTVAQAALDVFAVEPPSMDNKVVLHKNVIATPHLGASTTEAQEGVAIEIAEAVVGALNGELSETAVNAPMVPPEVLSELTPYLHLAEKLGKIAVQLVSEGRGIKKVKITYKSAREPYDLDTRVVRAMVTKGIIEPVSTSLINLVNADFRAKQRGLQITEERVGVDKSPKYPIYSIQVEISDVESKFGGAETADGCIAVEGRVRYGVPYLIGVGRTSGINVSLEGSLVLCQQVDYPGIIGQVGNALSDDGVNVNFMTVSRKASNHAIMAIGVDTKPSDVALKKIAQVHHIEAHAFLDL